MADRFNTIAGWTLFSGIVAIGLGSLSGKYFEAGKHHRPHEMGYAIEGVVPSGGEAAAEQPIEALLAAADPAKGEASFKKCMSCHTINAGGAAGLGPNLHGIVGKGVAGGSFAYSDALKSHGGKWDWATLNSWLKNPAAFVKGTKMTFAGISGGEERANLLAYMNAQGSNLPLPAAPAPAEAAAPAEGDAAATAPAAAPAEPAKK
jgi:cytochrome c